MKKVLTLKRGHVLSFDMPEEGVERSCFGAIRLFPGTPRVVTEDELRLMLAANSDFEALVSIADHVESRRSDRRVGGDAPRSPAPAAEEKPAKQKKGGRVRGE